MSTAESGFYKCISKGLFDESQLKINSIELIVKNDWEHLWENDYEVPLDTKYVKLQSNFTELYLNFIKTYF